MDNKFVHNLEFPKDINNKIQSIFCEIDENLILFDASRNGSIENITRNGLILVDIRDNNAKLFKKFNWAIVLVLRKLLSYQMV